MIILTIDTDWAPDWATREVLERVKNLNTRCSVFFSTPNPVEPWPLLEVGVHPDLSLAGGDPAAENKILAEFRGMEPQAACLRTHRFYWHSDLPRTFKTHGFTIDSSMILPYHPHLMGLKIGSLKRFPVWASDHLHLARHFDCGRLRLPNLDEPGLKIFCFHVAYLQVNAASLADFNMIEAALGSVPAPVNRDRPGVWNLFELLAERIYAKGGGARLDEIPDEFFVKGLP